MKKTLKFVCNGIIILSLSPIIILGIIKSYVVDAFEVGETIAENISNFLDSE